VVERTYSVRNRIHAVRLAGLPGAQTKERRRKMASIRFLVLACLILVPGVLGAEEPTDAVRALLPWTRDIIGNPDEWVYRAETMGFKVNRRPGENCVVVFSRDYGYGVNRNYGHVAVLRTKDPRKGYLIQDSSGFGGCERCTKWVRKIDFRKAWFIHPPKKGKVRGF
jgi:hypothetical protein